MTDTVADNAEVNSGTSQAASADLASDTDTSADTSAGMTVRRRRRFHENRIDQVGSRKREKAARRRRRRTGGRGTIGTEVVIAGIGATSAYRPVVGAAAATLATPAAPSAVASVSALIVRFVFEGSSVGVKGKVEIAWEIVTES